MDCLECRDRPVAQRGLCGRCYSRHRTRGTLERVALTPRTGREKAQERTAQRPQGEIRIDNDGYIREWVGRDWLIQHRRVMESVLGRKLLPGENVHHINGNRADNRPENLELWFRPQPGGQRVGQLLDYVVKAHAEELKRRLAID